MLSVADLEIDLPRAHARDAEDPVFVSITLGAAGEVTGSCHILTIRDRRVLLDCGLIQGPRSESALNFEPFPFDVSRIDAVVLSHAHIDHVRDLATIADNRCQLDCGPLLVGARRETVAQLQAHFFNDILWPDFTRIPSVDVDEAGPSLSAADGCLCDLLWSHGQVGVHLLGGHVARGGDGNN